MKKLLFVSLLAMLSLCANAYDFMVDGIGYNITGDNTVEVVKPWYGPYSGKIVIPNNVIYGSKKYSVTSIGDYAFKDCMKLTSVNIPKSVTSIGEEAFAYCWDLTSINIPKGVKSIGDYAFRDCSGLTSINIPESVTSIGNSAFNRCSSLTSINIPKGVTSIGNFAFYQCSGLTSINIPESVTSIGNYAFKDCMKLTSINISEGVTSIGEYAFCGCSNLTSIDIPESVTSIREEAFWGCISLADIYCYAFTPADIKDSYTFSQETYSNCKLHVPYGTTNAYKAANGWKNFSHIVEFAPTGVEAVSAGGKFAAGQRIYNLGGVRMAAPQRGLNIINGKKVMVK